jgi:hydrogenase nickel incorporation protein HypA/HybF
MHELSAVQTLVDSLLEDEQVRSAHTVEVVRVRRGAAISHEAIRLGFDALTRDTPLEGARLEIEELAVLGPSCHCGEPISLGGSDLAAQMYVCPACSYIHDLARAADLELIEIKLRD